MAVRRTDVAFDLGLRGFTEGLAARLHAMAASRVTPPAVYKAKCENCSLIGRCMPKRLSDRPSAAAYLARALADYGTDGADGDGGVAGDGGSDGGGGREAVT